MIHDSDLVYGHKGKLYKYTDHWSNASYTVPPDEVIITDGFQRMVLTFNNSVPGPPIIVYEGQTVSREKSFNISKNLLLSALITFEGSSWYTRAC